MRKSQRKQADEIIKLLSHVHEGIKNAIAVGQYDSAMELLAQCQESAIELGQAIEETEGEGFVTVSFLENYCEAVYQVYALANQKQSMNANRIYKNLRKALIQVENSVKNDIKIRREAVFLPYKASMWDSLESVWKAADEDPGCDAYVIPIPYYDRNPDGSFREEHYEGDLYPDYVPVTRYDEYDFEERRPDMIFIHNPYDNNNYVTSVHPFFYSSNLKNFTDKLVYIPYFILQEIDPDNKAQTEGMVNYCVVPGVIHADKVIVQSEAMRQVYIKVLMENTEGGDRKYWEEKILGLGSPKVDKVLSTRKEDLEIPDEWLKIIEKPDGSWKKIIFYNTGITGLLQNDEKMLRKMKDVFRVFKENRDEVALLWRPHPLIKATIESMRPQLWEDYREIVEEYRSEGWGIYDDSADMNRAIGVSDAYYGDHSSVVSLFQKAKKFIVIQNVNLISNNEIKLSCADALEYNDRIFILTRDTQSLFEYYPETMELKLCGRIANKPGQVFISMALCSEKIYFAPYEADEICIYDIKQKKLQYILLKQTTEKVKEMHYHMIITYQQKVFFLGGTNSLMLCIDSSTHALKEVTEWKDEFRRAYGFEPAIETQMDKCIVGDCFWVALKGENLLMQYNMKTGEYNFWNVGKTKIQYTTVTFDGEYFWLTGDKEFIVRWKKENNDVKEFDNFPDGFKGKYKKIGWTNLFRGCCVRNNNIYFIPLNSNMLVKVNCLLNQIKCVKKIEDDDICMNFIKMNNDRIYVEEDDKNTISCKKIFCIEENDNCLPCVVKIPKQDIYNIVQRDMRDIRIILENYPGYMSSFINLIKRENYQKIESYFNKKGENIWRLI